jgi:hypothetical protein
VTLKELETRLQELRDQQGALDTDSVWIPCCSGWAELGLVSRKDDLAWSGFTSGLTSFVFRY